MPNIFSKHVFLSHDWGTYHSRKGDDDLVENHTRVKMIYEGLSLLGIQCWFDEQDMRGIAGDPTMLPAFDEMSGGIDTSVVVGVFITKRYMEKVGQSDMTDNCKKEFLYADVTKGGQNMIGIIMDPEVGLPKHWRGPVALTLGSPLYVDFSNFRLWLPGNESLFEEKISELARRIISLVSLSASASSSATVGGNLFSFPSLSYAISASVSKASQTREFEIDEELTGLLIEYHIEKFADVFLTNLVLNVKDVSDLTIAEIKEDLGLPSLPAKRLFTAATALISSRS
jgi:hypothetical protein